MRKQNNRNHQSGKNRNRHNNANNNKGNRPQENSPNSQQQNNRRDPSPNQLRKENNTAAGNYGKVIESHVPKSYKAAFYETFNHARNDLPALTDLAKSCDQLNIIIKAEGDMNDPVLRPLGMVFAGAAWHLIHTRRVEEGWYNEKR